MIESIVKRTLEVLPRYGSTFWTLLTHPVAEAVPRSCDGRLVWDAMLFWAVSLAIYLLTRYIAFSPNADPVLFFVARGISSVVQLLLVSLAFYCVWRLFGARYQLGSFIIATACIHGVVLPLEAILNIGLFGIVRIIDEEIYRILINSLNGCGQIMTPTALRDAMEARMHSDPSRLLMLIGVYFLLMLPFLGMLIGYTVAYLRVLANLADRAARFGAARIVLMLGLGGILAMVGLFFTALFDWTLFNDQSLCLGAPDA